LRVRVLRITTTAASVLVMGLCSLAQPIAQSPAATAPQTLQETGLYADPNALEIDRQHLAFAPQYPLWTDGASKRRWISLPPGTAIDASDPNAWTFPAGTRIWKEFSFAGQRVETRYMERQADGQWLYAAYAWSADGREAVLVSDRGRRRAHPLRDGRWHAIPSVTDCKACHQGGRSEVLGFSALQLSPDRDPGALHAGPLPVPDLDLNYLVEKGLLVGLATSPAEAAPRIAATSATERAALGYLHGNCGHCHNDQGSLQNLGLFLRHVAGSQVEAAVNSTFGRAVNKPAPGQSPDAALRIEPGHPDRRALMQRMSSRYSALQMPPLGTELVDAEAITLLQRWISEQASSAPATPNQDKGDQR
jgi:hypothetical protein